MPIDRTNTRLFSDTAFVDQMLDEHRIREHDAKALAPKTRKIVRYEGTTPIYEDDVKPTFVESVFAVFR